MKNETRELLIKCGVPQHINGYQYLGTAIDAVLEDPGRLKAVTKVLYPLVAAKHNTTYTRVERAIRHAIEASFHLMKYDNMVKLFGSSIDPERGKPTNSHYIAALAEALKAHETD